MWLSFKLYFKKTKLMVLSILLLIATIKCGLVNIDVSSNPNEAHAENVVFTFYASLSDTLGQGSSIWMFIPQEVAQLQNGLSNICTFSAPAGLTAQCSYQQQGDGRLLYKFESLSQEIQFGEDLQVTIDNFNNPISTAETASFEFQVYRQNGALVDIYNQDIFLLLVASDLSAGLSLTSSSDIVGVKDATLTIQFKLVHDIEVGQYIAVKFPYISDEAPNSQKVSVLQQGASSTITPISQNLPSTLPLEWDEASQTLFIKINIFVEGETQIKPGVFVPSVTTVNDGIVEFSIYPIHNPVSTQRLPGFVISTMTAQKDGYIETTLGTAIFLKVFTPYSIQPEELTLTMNQTQIQKYSRYQIDVSIDIPVNKDCVFEFRFPSKYFFFDQNKFKTFSGAGAAGGGALLYNRVDQETQTLFTTQSGFTTYTNNKIPFILRFDLIRNSDFAITTPSIMLNIYDSQMNRIAQNTEGLEATILPGKIYLFPLEAHPSNFVLDKTYIHMKLQPESLSAADAKLVITFPNEEGLMLPSQCILSDFGTLVRSDVVCQSDLSSMTLTITNLLRQAYSYNSAVKIEFDVADVTLPLSSKPFGEFKFQIFSQFDGVYQLIDEGKSSGLFQPQSREMKFSNAIALNQIAYQSGSYTFQIQASAFIPQGGQIKVVMSDDVILNSQATCFNFGQYIFSSAFCSADTDSRSITLQNGFQSSAYKGGQIVQFDVDNIQNPRSLAPTSYFQLFTLDQFGYVIEQSQETAFVEMTQSQKLADIKIETESKIVGEETNYYISFRPLVPLYLGDYLEFKVPSQIQSYIGSSLDYCQGIENLVEDLACYAISQNTLKVILKPLGSQIQPYVRVKFMVSELRNPNSTAETDNFDLKIFDTQQYLVSVTSSDAEASVQMEQPCPILYSFVTHSSRAAYETTLFTFTIKTVHELPPGSFVRVQWPTEIEVDEEADFQCTISTRLEGLSRTCRPLTSYVLLQDINDDYISSGTTIQIGIFGLKNSKFAQQTSSFTVTTMLDRYTEVDQAFEGLVVENTCDWPCKQCDSRDPSICLTCKSTSGYPILHENQCLRECPREGGFFEANLRCNRCDESCLECEGTPNFCTSCPPDKYLLGHSCYDQCPSNSIVNEYKRYCVLCEPPCATCQNAVDQCTSCMLNVEQRYFWQGECINECPRDITLWIGPESFCTRCNRKCATCSGDQNACTSCRAGLKLDTVEQTCKETCPELISVDMGDTCEPCNNICETCSATSQDECLSCRSGTAYLEKEKTCVTHCPEGTAKILKDEIYQCIDCNEGCLDCQGTTSYCTSCDDSLNFLFHQFTCIPDKCPKGFRRLSPDRNTCVPENEYCKYGYAYNDQAICVLAVAECPEGSILNQTLDKCVVLPGTIIPFLFLGLSLLWTLYVLTTSFKKEPSNLSIISQLLLGYDFVLQACSIVLIWLCSIVGLDLLSTINFSVLAFLVIENAILSIWVSKRSMVEDQAFKYWTQYNPKATTIFLTTSSLWSFKFIRAFYSKAFNGNKSFNAAFDTKFKTIVRPLFLVSMVHFTCLQLPLVMTDIYVITVIPPKYKNQITTVAFDNLLLQLTVFALEILEFNMMRFKSKMNGSDAEDKSFLPKFRKMRMQALDQIKVKSNYLEDDFLQNSRLELDQSHLPLNILDWQHASTTRYKRQLHDLSSRAPTTKPKPVNEEVVLLEQIVTKLKQTRKYKDQAQKNNVPDRAKYQDPKRRKNRIEVIKANKQKFSVIKRRNFVIRDIVKKIEVSPRTQEIELQQLNKNHSKTKSQDSTKEEQENWQKMKLCDVWEHINDRKDYKRYLNQFKEERKKDREQKIQSGQVRVNKSFDDEIMRADYEFMGDDLSQERSRDGESAMTFPFCKDDHRIDLDDPREMADLEVFRDRVKRKFCYNNCGIEVQEEAIYRQPGAKATQTQYVEARDPFDTSESSISEVSWVFSDDVEEQLYQLSNNVAQDLVEKAILLNISDSSDDSLKSEEMPESKKSRRQSSIENLKQQSFVFEQKMRASQQRFEDLQKNGGQILQDHLDPAVQRLVSQSSMRTTQTPMMAASSRRLISRMASQKDQTEKSIHIDPPLSLKDIVALKLQEQVDEIQKEMEAEGFDEDKLSGEEVDLARSELQRLQELSLGKPSDDEDDQKIKDTAVNDNSSVGASEFQKFSAISQSRTKRKNKRLNRLEKAYGNKKKNPEILSLKDTSYKRPGKLAMPKQPSKNQDYSDVNELFGDITQKDRQATERKQKKDVAEPLSSSRSSSQSRIRGSIRHGRSLSMPFDDENNEQMREFISGQINNVMVKRGKNPKIGKDLLDDGLIDQEELNLEREMNEILNNAQSPKNMNIQGFNELFAPDDEVKYFPTTQKKKRQESSLIGDSKNKSQDSLMENEWKELDLSESKNNGERSSIQFSKLPEEKSKNKKFNKFEHLLFDNIIEQKIEKDIKQEKKRLEEKQQKDRNEAPKAIAFYSSKKILAQGGKQDFSKSKMTSSRMQGNSLMISQIAKSKIDSIKDIYNSKKPYQQSSQIGHVEMSSTYSNQRRNPFLMASSSNPKLARVGQNDSALNEPYQEPGVNLVSNKRNSQVLGVNRSTSALGQPRGLSQIMKHNYMSSSGGLPPYKPDRESSIGQSDKLSHSANKHDFHKVVNPLVLSDDSGNLKDSEVNGSENSSKTLPNGRQFLLQAKAKRDLGEAVAEFSKGAKLAREQARKKNAEQILKM